MNSKIAQQKNASEVRITTDSFFKDFIAKLQYFLIKKGFTEEDALIDAINLAFDLGKDFGGEWLYFGKGRSLGAIVQNDEIAAAYNGKNHTDVAKQFNVTRSHVKRVSTVKAIIARKEKKRGFFRE